jgi:hypothetical protein
MSSEVANSLARTDSAPLGASGHQAPNVTKADAVRGPFNLGAEPGNPQPTTSLYCSSSSRSAQPLSTTARSQQGSAELQGTVCARSKQRHLLVSTAIVSSLHPHDLIQEDLVHELP